MHDVIVVGSGFGGSVAALRLTEAGHDVLLLERGRRLSEEGLLRARTKMGDYLWQPSLGLRGFFWQRIMRHVAVIGGTGLGGGSIVWAGVLLPPRDTFYEQPQLQRLGLDWRQELKEPLERAQRMLGRAMNPIIWQMDENLRRTAAAMGREETWGPVPVAIHFGRPGVTEPDPFFSGEGPERTGCRHCGECLLGCPYGAKNQLTRNYLWLAEKYGLTVETEHDVQGIRPLPDGGYEVTARVHGQRLPARFRAKHVILAAGVLSTVELLARCRDETRTLPQVSQQLGRQVRTNSEAITAVLGPVGTDLAHGPTISSDFHPDDDTHATQNRYMGGWHMRGQLGPLVDGEEPGPRRRAVLKMLTKQLPTQVRDAVAPRFLNRLTVISTMQQTPSELDLVLRRRGRRRWLSTQVRAEGRPPSYIEVANRTTRTYASITGGRAMNLLGESVGNLSVTAHVLGGAQMGLTADDGVVDVNHEVFGHPGLFVADASVVPVNLGVNPSLTVTALAERFTDRYVERFPGSGATRSPARARPVADGQPRRASEDDVARVEQLRRGGLTGGRESDGRENGNATMNQVDAPDTLMAARKMWSSLSAPQLSELEGDLRASFLSPLKQVAPAGLGLIGLPRWWGKRVSAPAVGARTTSGTNLLRSQSGAGLDETMPMCIEVGTSLIDAESCVVVTYGPSTRKPWPWVRDELRRLDENTWLGMTVVDLPVLRRTGGTPFLLHRG